MKRKAYFLYSLETGGAERVAYNSIVNSPLVDHISLILVNGPIEFSMPLNIEVYYLRKQSSNRLFRLCTMFYLPFKLSSTIKKISPDTIISFDLIPNLVSLIAQYFSASQVRHIIRVSNHIQTRWGSGSVLSRVTLFLIKWLYPKADKIIVNSKGIYNDIISLLHLRSEQVEIVYNKVLTSQIQSLRSTKRIDRKRFTFLHVGNLRPQKNQDLLLRAFYRLSEVDADLKIIGKGELEHALIDLIEELHMEDRVEMLGFQANPYNYMDAYDVLVLSSDYEGFPNVLLEAILCDMIVIATDCKTGPSEILGASGMLDGFKIGDLELFNVGVLTPVNDVEQLSEAMRIIVQNKPLRDKMRKNLPKAKALLTDTFSL